MNTVYLEICAAEALNMEIDDFRAARDSFLHDQGGLEKAGRFNSLAEDSMRLIAEGLGLGHEAVEGPQRFGGLSVQGWLEKTALASSLRLDGAKKAAKPANEKTALDQMAVVTKATGYLNKAIIYGSLAGKDIIIQVSNRANFLKGMQVPVQQIGPRLYRCTRKAPRSKGRW